MKKYLIFDLDGTLIQSMGSTVDLILDYIRKKDENLVEKARYIFQTTAGAPLLHQVKMIFSEAENQELITKELYEEIYKLDSEFFSGAVELIKKLSENYKIFLTTGNSQAAAEKHLAEAGIKDLFSLILGSDKILKGEAHISAFLEVAGDQDFFEKAVYIGDGARDREIANYFQIDFVHIGDEGDRYEIPEIKFLEKVLEKINSTKWKK